MRAKLKIDTPPKEKHWDDTFRMMSWWKPERVQEAKMMVVGAGALGNEVLKNLALLNVGHILIVDFDTIEYHNLCRSVLFRTDDAGANRLKSEVAAERIREINPNIKVMTIQGDIGIDVGLGVFRRMDVVIGCLDNRLARLFINQLCYKVGKTWVDGAIENLAGQLNVYQPGVSCYECQLTDFEMENIRFKMGCPDIARRNSNVGRIPTTPISSSIIGAMQVQEALKVIHGNEGQSLAGQVFQYEGMNNMVLQYKAAELREECPSHITYEVVEAKALSAESTIAEVLAWIKDHLGNDDFVIELDHELVLELTSKRSEVSSSIVIAKPHLSDQIVSKFQVIPGEDVMISESVSLIDHNFGQQNLKLKQIGIPPLHIIKVETGSDMVFIELTGDEAYLKFE